MSMPQDASVLQSTLTSPIHHTPSSPTFNLGTLQDMTSNSVPQHTVLALSPFQVEFQAMLDNGNDYEASHPSRHRDSFSSSSGSSSDPTSPIRSQPTSATLPSPTPLDADASDAPWNLVAYHIPWGSAYDGYKAGTLPGPSGTCVFLRSPTPTKRQRTSQACERCRERKAKCSGTRPSCVRCNIRGYICVYTPPPNSEPQQSPSCWSSLLRTSLTASSPRPGPLKLKDPVLRRLQRKTSVADSESSLGSGSRDTPGVQDGLETSVVSNDRSRAFEHRITDGDSCLTFTGGGKCIQPLSPLDPPPSDLSTSSFSPSLDLGSPSQGFSSLLRGRGHTFSGGPSAPLYADSHAALHDYRSPLPLPFEQSKDVLTAQPQPQMLRCRASWPQLSHSLADPKVPELGASSGPAWFSSERLEAVCENIAPGMPELLFPQPHSATSSESLLFSPQSYTGSFESPDQYAPYEVVEASFPHSAFDTPYGVDNRQALMPSSATWTPHEKGPVQIGEAHAIHIVEPQRA